MSPIVVKENIDSWQLSTLTFPWPLLTPFVYCVKRWAWQGAEQWEGETKRDLRSSVCFVERRGDIHIKTTTNYTIVKQFGKHIEMQETRDKKDTTLQRI